jgi:hypothetical protein
VSAEIQTARLRPRPWRPLAALLLIGLTILAPAARAERPRTLDAALFLGGAALGLAVHESGHLAADLALATRPRLVAVDFLGIPFFAIEPRHLESERERYVVSAAGFWTHNAAAELLLTRRPELRREAAPLWKGALAFHVLTSTGYAAAALARAGPQQRDTLGMARGLGVDERWIGALVLAPAALDAYRYARPEARWARWASRGAKLALFALALHCGGASC